MDPNTGQLYPSRDDALRAGVKDPVELKGSEAEILKIASDVEFASAMRNAPNRAARRALERSQRRKGN